MGNELGKTGRLAAIYATLAMTPATIVILLADSFSSVSVVLAFAFLMQAVFARLWTASIQKIRAQIDCAQLPIIVLIILRQMLLLWSFTPAEVSSSCRPYRHCHLKKLKIFLSIQANIMTVM